VTVVAHADWGVAPGKRWVAVARDGVLGAAEPVGDPRSLLARLGTPLLISFDFPIGVPARWAAAAGVDRFRDLLPLLGDGEWRNFYRVAERPEEISLRRPFHPQRPGGTSQAHLAEALGVESVRELLRACERATAERRAACCLFWTLGGNQVGKAALCGWREVLAPAAGEIAIWPFDGRLADLLRRHDVVVAETYPAELYRRLGIRLRGSKRDRAARREQAPALRRGDLTPAAVAAVEDGFGAGRDGEDRFDAFVGLLGMVELLREPSRVHQPDSPVEGWILGQAGP
jgi:hypothetical protein